MNHFGKVAFVLTTLITLLALNGALGETVDKVIKTWGERNRPVYIERQQTTPTPVTPNPPPTKQTGVLPQSADTTEKQ